MAAAKPVTGAGGAAAKPVPSPILKGYLKNVGTGKYLAFKFKGDLMEMESDIDAVLTTDLAKTIQLTLTPVTIPKAQDGPKFWKLVHWDESGDNWILDHCDSERVFLTNEDSTSMGQRWVIEDVQTESGVWKKIKESQGTMYLTAQKSDSDSLVLRNVENPLELLWLWNLTATTETSTEKILTSTTTITSTSTEKNLVDTTGTDKNLNSTTDADRNLASTIGISTGTDKSLVNTIGTSTPSTSADKNLASTCTTGISVSTDADKSLVSTTGTSSTTDKILTSTTGISTDADKSLVSVVIVPKTLTSTTGTDKNVSSGTGTEEKNLTSTSTTSMDIT